MYSPQFSLITRSPNNLSGGPALLADGTAAAPSLTFASGTNDGLYRVGAHELALSLNGAAVVDYFTSGTAYGSGYLFGWSSNADPTLAARDVVLRRSAAKTLTLDTDGAGGALTLVDVKGPLTVSGGIGAGGATATGSVSAPGNGSFNFVARTFITSPSDGTINFGPNSGTTGARWNYGTDGTGQLLAFGGGDTAILKANQLVATGAATSGGLTAAGTVGHPVVVAVGNVVAATNTGTAAIATVTPAVDTTYLISANCLVTTSTTHSFSLDCTYTDEGNVARTMVIPVSQLAGSFITSGLITNVTGAGPYESTTMTIRAKASTAVTIRTSAGGTFTTVVYNARGIITQVS